MVNKDDIKELVRQVVKELEMEYDLATEMTSVGNATSNISGFDGPWGPKVKRKLKDFEFTEEEDEKED